MGSSNKIKEHFNSGYTDYDACCNKVVPRNEELQRELVGAIPHNRNAELQMLDIGMGTGLTTIHVLSEFPNSHVDGIDFSSEMLKRAEQRLGRFNSRVNLIEADITKYDFEKTYDAVFSAVTIHNLKDREKGKIFNKIYNGLEDGGCFVNADFVKFNLDHLNRRIENFYFGFLRENLSGKELEHWLRHAKEEDMPICWQKQFDLLRNAGFSTVENVWFYKNLSVVSAIK